MMPSGGDLLPGRDYLSRHRDPFLEEHPLSPKRGRGEKTGESNPEWILLIIAEEELGGVEALRAAPLLFRTLGTLQARPLQERLAHDVFLDLFEGTPARRQLVLDHVAALADDDFVLGMD